MLSIIILYISLDRMSVSHVGGFEN